MGDDSRDLNRELIRVMTDGAERIVGGDEAPYDVGMGLMADLSLLFDADHGGKAYSVWGFLTDGIDGPPRYARGLTEPEIEDLMRRAAREWLALVDPSDDELTRYFKRWDDWPEPLAEGWQHESMTASTTPESQFRITHSFVTLAQFGLIAAFSAYLATESPEPLSLEDWAGILGPPLAFLLAWWLGRTVRTDSSSRSRSSFSRAGNVLTTIGLALTVLMVPILLVGSFMDQGIG